MNHAIQVKHMKLPKETLYVNNLHIYPRLLFILRGYLPKE